MRLVIALIGLAAIGCGEAHKPINNSSHLTAADCGVSQASYDQHLQVVRRGGSGGGITEIGACSAYMNELGEIYVEDSRRWQRT